MSVLGEAVGDTVDGAMLAGARVSGELVAKTQISIQAENKRASD